MICKMAFCMFWLLTYVGQGLDLAVGKTVPVIIQVQGNHEFDYRHGIRKKSELNSVDNHLLNFRVYPTDGSPHMRDDMSNWLVFNDEPRISSWSPASMLIDDMVKEPRELQNVFFALSPAMFNVLYSDHVTSSSQSHAIAATQPYVPHDESGNQLIGDGRQRAKKRRIGCRHSLSVLPSILVCDEAGKKTAAAAAAAAAAASAAAAAAAATATATATATANVFQEPKKSNHDDLYAKQRFNTATSTKTDSARAETDATLNLPKKGGFIPKAFAYETDKLPIKKRNQITVGRRSIDAQRESPGHQAQPSSVSSAGASIASQLMLRTIRGSIQYDVPQIECPISEDGMERFACPTADRMGRYHCIDDHVLCDGFIDCPTGEDEDRQACMFYKTTKAHLDVLADAILRWARGR